MIITPQTVQESLKGKGKLELVSSHLELINVDLGLATKYNVKTKLMTANMMMRNLPKILLFLCAVALLVGLVIYAAGMKHTTNRAEITFVIKTDTDGDVTSESKALADFVIEVISKEEHILSDKYQYVIEQQAKTQDFLAIGGILIGIIVSIVGFFGYDKMQAIEEKAHDIATNSAKQAFSEELKVLQEKHNLEYLEKTVKPHVNKQVEESIASFIGEKASQIDNIEQKVNVLEPAVSELSRRVKPHGQPTGGASQPQPEPQPFGNGTSK